MGRNQVRRKLTTVFCADVQSYSRMMARDEAGTLDRLRRYRGIMEALFARHEGRLVNTWGDAVIAEFASVVEAVRCAVEIQDALGAENRDLPEDEQMWFRIGINLGDVMQDGDDIYGDGVNIASRMEQLSEPGGVMVSQSVYEFAHRQLAIAFDYAGPQAVVEDQQPVVGYRIRTGGSNFAPAAERASAPLHANGEAQAQTGPAAPNATRTPLQQAAAFGENFLSWFGRQQPGIRRSVFMIGFFFAINLLFTGLATPWFIFPAAPFALYILMKGDWKGAS